MNKITKLAALYIATLKSLLLIHQHNHWTTYGSNFYGNHLLFERLYDSVVKNLDTVAERLITLDENCLNFDLQTELLNKILLKYKDLEGSPIEMSLNAEKDFLNFSNEFYNILKNEEKLTLGLDDLIMSVAHDRETSIYLLNRILKKEK